MNKSVKDEIESKIEFIENCNAKFITYMATSHKAFLNEVLEYIDSQEQKLKRIEQKIRNK